MRKIYLLPAIIFLVQFITACKSSIRQQEDKLYSRHLQKHVALTIISTSVPKDKGDMNLLLVANQADLGQFRMKGVVDSLYDQDQIKPLVLVAIDGNQNVYGWKQDENIRLSSAEKFEAFIINELYPYIKKKTAIRKFSSVSIFGNEASAINAFGIAWQNADKINKVGIFSPDVNSLRDTTESGFMGRLKLSRKRPRLEYYFQTIIKEKDSLQWKQSEAIISILQKKNISSKADIRIYSDNITNSNHFASFLLWAVGRN